MFRAPQTLSEAFPTVRFRRLNGHVELAVAEAAAPGGVRPTGVTRIIVATCAELAGIQVDAAVARRVSAAGREWLLNRAAMRFHRERDWFEAPCASCGTRFDIQLSMEDVPRVPAAAGFPVVEVGTTLGLRSFEAPNGAHEEAVARRQGDDPRRVFAALCGLSAAAEAEAIRFDPEDLDRIDRALETVSPEIADGVDVTCPECGAAGRVRIDALTFAFPAPEDVLREVHLLASAYRWPERAILDLPVARRRAYAGMIRAERRGWVPGRPS